MSLNTASLPGGTTPRRRTRLFEYRIRPSFGRAGEPGGYSISVYGKGEVIRREYLFGSDHPNSEATVAAMPELAEAVQAIIMRYSETLKTIPNTLDNGSCDGSQIVFVFGRKTICTWNPVRLDPSALRRNDPEYYERYKDVVEQENIVLDVYEAIAREIKRFVPDIPMEFI